MMTLIDEMHLHINDIEEDEVTQHKKREKKLMATLEHAMDGMKRYKGRARGVEVSSSFIVEELTLDTLIDGHIMSDRLRLQIKPSSTLVPKAQRSLVENMVAYVEK